MEVKIGGSPKLLEDRGQKLEDFFLYFSLPSSTFTLQMEEQHIAFLITNISELRQ